MWPTFVLDVFFYTNGDVYFYIAFETVLLHVLYPLPSNIMHPKAMKLKKVPNNQNTLSI